MKKVIWASVAVILVAVLVKVFAFGPSDKEMIQAALDESLSAARDGKPSPVLDYLSSQFEINGQRIADRPEIARVVRTARPKITVQNREPQIMGDTATIVSSVQVDADYLGFTMNQTIPNVTIRFKKESGTRYVVVPYPKWRIIGVEAEGLPTDYAN